MEEGGRDEEASLPPDYVSLAQLQEQWMQKQREKKMREKEEEEKRNDGGGCARGVVGRREGKIGGESGVVEERGKEKEKDTVIGGFGNGGKYRKRHGRKKNSRSGGMKSVRGEGKGEEIDMGKVGIEKGVENELEIVAETGLKEVKEIASVAMVEVLPRNRVNGVSAGVRRGDFRGGLRKNGHNRGPFYWTKKENGGGFNELKQSEETLAFEKKVEDKRGHDQQPRGGGRRKNSGYRRRYDKMKESTPDVLKGNEVKLELKKGEEEILELFNEKCGLSVRDSDEVECQSKNGNSKIEEDVVEVQGSSDDKTMDHEVLVLESGKNGVRGRVGSGYSKNVISKIKENVVEGVGSSDDKKKVCHEVLALESGKIGERRRVGPRYTGNRNWRGDSRRFMEFRRYEEHSRMKQRESGKVWVKKEEKLGSNAGISVGQE